MLPDFAVGAMALQTVGNRPRTEFSIGNAADRVNCVAFAGCDALLSSRFPPTPSLVAFATSPSADSFGRPNPAHSDVPCSPSSSARCSWPGKLT